MATEPTRRPLRVDAARNRVRLVETAAEAFREDGLGVSVNAIAARAGVNVATLYRHFPTKDALVGAVLESVLEPLALARDRALAATDGHALEAFVREAVQLQSQHAGLVEALGRGESEREVRSRLREPAMAIVAPIVKRAHEEGDLRPDLGTQDLLIVLQMLSLVAGSAEHLERYVDVLLRGLR